MRGAFDPGDLPGGFGEGGAMGGDAGDGRRRERLGDIQDALSSLRAAGTPAVPDLTDRILARVDSAKPFVPDRSRRLLVWARVSAAGIAAAAVAGAVFVHNQYPALTVAQERPLARVVAACNAETVEGVRAVRQTIRSVAAAPARAMESRAAESLQAVAVRVPTLSCRDCPITSAAATIAAPAVDAPAVEVTTTWRSTPVGELSVPVPTSAKAAPAAPTAVVDAATHPGIVRRETGAVSVASSGGLRANDRIGDRAGDRVASEYRPAQMVDVVLVPASRFAPPTATRLQPIKAKALIPDEFTPLGVSSDPVRRAIPR